uniref:AlNc14C551G12135 protein n=1 Tax=Albugo laibachii Nc14 TaxID=890382 RepID=F0X143_9STRA|nr:AlNc14C551G12135 [Albugo laibachii Nc14]|eukprot:CCA27497.1 AlNc14C551G12135 [Albugo laibachii Nc14]
MTALSRGEDEDVEYWEWLEDHWWYHYAIQDGVKAPSSIRGYLQEEKEELNWDSAEVQLSGKGVTFCEVEDKEDSNWNEPLNGLISSSRMARHILCTRNQGNGKYKQHKKEGIFCD